MSQQAVTTTITDIKVKFGKSAKGAWELATIVGSDNKKYKTFDAALTARAKEAMGSSATVEILYESTQKTFTNEKNEVVPYEDREIKDLVLKSGAAPAPVPQTSHAAPAGLSNDERIIQDRVAYRRQATMTALEVAGQVMAACIASGVETYKYDDAMRLAKAEAKALYAAYFKPLEGGPDADPNTVTDPQEEPEVVE